MKKLVEIITLAVEILGNFRNQIASLKDGIESRDAVIANLRIAAAQDEAEVAAARHMADAATAARNSIAADLAAVEAEADKLLQACYDEPEVPINAPVATEIHDGAGTETIVVPETSTGDSAGEPSPAQEEAPKATEPVDVTA